MGSNTKWIEGHPDDMAHDVARLALERRLERMSHYLGRAVLESACETENVHQLRIFSRRTAAAMEIFEDWLPKRRGKWMQKRVKRIRKAAGAARDFDVLLIRWTDHMHHAPSSHTALLIEQIRQRRKEAQEPIEAIYKKLHSKRMARHTKKLLKRLHRRDSVDTCGDRFVCLARVALARVVGPYLATARAELDDAAAMHAFRIQSKQVRYAMEIFAGAFDEAFRTELYPLVVTLQDRLGAINDHVTAQTYFAGWHAEAGSCAVRAALEMGIDREQQALEASRRAFLDWWTAARREDMCHRFARYVEIAAADIAAADPDRSAT